MGMAAMRVLLIAERAEQGDELEAALRAAGHQLVARSGLQSGYGQRLAGLAAELLILSIDRVTRELLRELRLLSIPLLIFAARQGEVETEEVLRAGVSAYVVDGFKRERLAAVMELAQARFKQVEGLRLELSKSRQALEERKEIDRAKGIIMKQKGCSEEDAYQLLRKAAMDQNKRIGEVARNIVSLAALLG